VAKTIVIGGDADDTAVAIGARYFFTDLFAVTAEYELSDDAGTWFAGVRPELLIGFLASPAAWNPSQGGV
jgi:hypothetical protein